MKPLLVNFSKLSARKQRRRDWTVLLLGMLLIVFIAREGLSVQQQQNTQQDIAKRSTESVEVIAPFDPEKRKLAETMAHSLNLPWHELFAALEEVKQQHEEVYLTALLPDVRKRQIIIEGEVKHLQQLLAYIDSLNQHALFSDVLPVSQQQTQPVANGMSFTLKLGWRHE